MPNCVKKPLKLLLLCLLFWSQPNFADDFAAKVRNAELLESPQNYSLNARIDYQLSPTAKEALQMGVPLAWEVIIKISQVGWLMDSSVYEKKLAYYLEFNALLNQYAVKSPDTQVEMFLTLNAALNYMAVLHNLIQIDKTILKKGYQYQLAFKTKFVREFLPVPLRPYAYLNPQWYLSSDWFIWSIQK